jgi:hypothetical protein
LVLSAAAAWLAAAGFASVDEWLGAWPRLRPVLLLGLAGLTLGPLIPRAFSVTAAYARPAEIDRAAAWVEERHPRLVLTSLNRLALDAPVEVRTRFQPGALATEVLRHYDLLVVHPNLLPELPGFAELARFEDPGFAWGALRVLRPDPPLRLVRVPPDHLSGSAAGIERAFDGDLGSAWAAPAGPTWCEASWFEPQRIVRIDLAVGGDDLSWPQTVVLEGREPGGPWRSLTWEALRPVRRARQSLPHGQVFVLTPSASLEAVRLTRPSGGAWLLAELTVAKTAPDP